MLPLESFILALASVPGSVAIEHYSRRLDPQSVSRGIRNWWCESQVKICPAICAQVAGAVIEVNQCDPDKLIYGCRCEGHVKPEMKDYTLTLEYYMCMELNVRRVRWCRADTICIWTVLTDYRCGANLPGYNP